MDNLKYIKKIGEGKKIFLIEKIMKDCKVYKAFDSIANSLRAVKEYPSSEMTKNKKSDKSVLNTIKNLFKITNPNVIKIYKVENSSNHMYLVYEYCNGRDLKSFLNFLKK